MPFPLLSLPPPRLLPPFFGSQGRKSMLRLAGRMLSSFCLGLSSSPQNSWQVLDPALFDAPVGPGAPPEVRVMTRRSNCRSGEPSGVILNATASVWLPVPVLVAFDFLKDGRMRREVRAKSADCWLRAASV